VTDKPVSTDAEALVAEMRSALQQQRAAYERMVETQREMEALLDRARDLLGRNRNPEADRPASPTTPPADG
jgi:hypothetical protein